MKTMTLLMRRQALSLLLGAPVLLGTSLFGLGACGFKIRGAVNLPFKAIYISGPVSVGLRADLETAITTGSNAKIVSNARDADLILEIVSELNSRDILTYNATGQITAYRLTTRVNFRAFETTGVEIVPEAEIYVTRDMDFTVSTVLSADFQQQQFLQLMRRDLALQMLRRVAASARMLQPPVAAPAAAVTSPAAPPSPASPVMPTKP
jgi:LPS-assembly lipoprotein